MSPSAGYAIQKPIRGGSAMNHSWTLKEICRHTNGALHGTNQERITTLAFDSRKVSPTPDTLFVALPGEQHDGHRYIEELYKLGIRAFLVSRLPGLSGYPDAGFCLVDDTTGGLQQLASAWRGVFTGEVAAITGSNGKTIVKEWIYQIMNGHFALHRSPKSYNSQIGVPLSVWMIQEHHDLAVIEAGISKPGEMERLEGVIAPHIGLFTNLGSAHQENFVSLQEKLEEKLKLFRGCRKIIFRSGSDPEGLQLREFIKKRASEAETVDWSLEGDAPYQYRIEAGEEVGTGILAETPAGSCSFRLPFGDDASIENALHAFTFSLEMGLPVEVAVERIEMLEPVSMRMEILRGINGSVLINDAYNSDIRGLSAALDLLNQQERNRERVLILSDLLQSGLKDQELYSEIARLTHQKGITRFVGIGPAMMQHRDLFPPASRFFADTGEFLKQLDRTLCRDSSVLIKGSRKFGFERITAELQLKTHQTLLEIDLNAMAGNLNHYRSLIGEGVKTMVMVKALSYGSGNVEVASLLQYHQVDYLAVAFIDEGIDLRKAGIHLPIMVMNPDPSGYGQMIDFNLEPELFSFKGVESLYSILRYREIERYPVHIKLDTGMHRLGFQEEDLDRLIPLLMRKAFRVTTVFSHLAASDEPAHDSFTLQQIGRFEKAAGRLSESLEISVGRHLLNSAGIERFPQAQFQMVRLGIGLHGVGGGKGLVPSSTYKTSISQVRGVEKGETIGYSRSGKAASDMLVATIPVGYADGMDRRLGNGAGSVWINGVAVPTIGNICMDMTMIDVTGMKVAEGDGVELFGKNLAVKEVARWAGTIPYEILTSIPERVKRVYLQE
ncbi:MAG: bifunctional UDP-N-acetylmuramoyl-tripeptide:D-alanyl-D-alanine ligase/alanine racemase [Bacteroidota bacterium]